MTSTLLPLWRLLDRRQQRQLVALQLLSVLMAFSTVGGIASIIPFFTVLADPSAISHSAILHTLYRSLHFDDEGSFVMTLGVGFAATVLLGNAINFAGLLVIDRFSFRVGDTFHERLFDEYLRRDYGFHSRSNSSALAAKLLHETARVTSGILEQYLSLVTNLVTVIFIVVAIAVLNPLVAFGAIVGLGACYALIYAVARRRLLHNGLIESNRYSERLQTVNESFGAIKEIILLQARDFFVQRFANQCRSISRANLSTLAISQLPKHILECATVISLIGVALYFHGGGSGMGAWMAQLSFIGLAAYRLLPALQQAFAAGVRIRANHSAFDGVALDLQNALAAAVISRGSSSAAAAASFGTDSPEIRLHSASFRYSTDAPAAVSNLSLSIPSGAILGLVGANGSGKTTVADILAGLLIPQSGYVEIDGVPLNQANRSCWQSTVAYVPQRVYVLDATLAENIALGVPPEQIDIARLQKTVKLSCLEDCVAALPGGLREKLREDGRRLSGGQRQRLGIARALYRDASLLILDEATAALDNAAEEDVLNMLDRLRPGRTIVMIGHQLSALRLCDVIVELRNGTAARSGSLEEFLPKMNLRAMDISGRRE